MVFSSSCCIHLPKFLGSALREGGDFYSGLSSNLYDLQLNNGELLPDFHLCSGEVVRTGKFPSFGTHATDVYEG